MGYREKATILLCAGISLVVASIVQPNLALFSAGFLLLVLADHFRWHSRQE